MYVHRVTEFKKEDDVQVRLSDGSIIEGEYFYSTDAFVVIANEAGQFSLSVSNVVWIRKDLAGGDY